jgi:mono/diheme cytochrome c family protein
MRHPALFSLVSALLSVVPAVAAPPQAELALRHRALLEAHCQNCHGAEKQKGKFRVDDLSFSLTDPLTAERWQKVLDALNSGEMPPEDEKQPPAQEKADLLDDLAHTLVTARKSLSDQHGVITLRRLNQRELKNTLRALLGVDADVSDLPSDAEANRFDTIGANLFMSSNQLEQYEEVAKEALNEAAFLNAARGTQKQLRIESETTIKVISDYYNEGKDAYERAKAWVQGVEAAAAKPENAEIVAELRKNSKNDAMFRRSWEKIPGAPSPESFGFKTTENNADKANRAYKVWPDEYAYAKRYLELPALDTGAYLAITDVDGSRNGSLFIRFPGDFPPGDYIIRVRAGLTPHATPERSFIDFGFKGRGRPISSVHEVRGTVEAPEMIEIPFHGSWRHRDQNQNALYIRERGTADNYEQLKFKMGQGRKQNGVGFEPAIWVDWIDVERVPEKEDAVPPGVRALGISMDDKKAPPKPDELRAALQRFAVEAFRGVPPTERYVDHLMALYTESRAGGAKHSVALRDTLAVVLASPKFLYRAEPAPSETRRPLHGPEMAIRLSYFLWGAPPDAALVEKGRSGELLKPEVLNAETDRLLDDPRSMEFVRPFVRQWLNMDRLDFFQFNPALFPRFDYAIKHSAKQEVFESLALLLKENGSVRNLLKADYVVVNSALANFYGLEGVHGDAFRKVPVPDGSPRGGFLGMSAVLAMGSNGEHTSPVERGAWVLRKVLNDPPPPAPANVPALTRLAGKALTTKERVQAHQESPQCASCHRKIDPIGFGLENFDAVGLWRTEDNYQAMDDQGKPIPNAKKTWTIDPSGAFHRGPTFQNFTELREVVATRGDAFARGLASALVEYGLGRPCGFSDETLVDSLVAQAKQRDFALREFLHALIQSEPFHRK